MNQERRTSIVQIAEAYVADAQAVLLGAVPDADTPDMAAFGERAVSVLMALVFSSVFEKEGKEAAEKWLGSTLSLMSANTRMMGTPALVKVQVEVKDAPNPFKKALEAAAAAIPEPAPQVQPVPALPDPKKREECATKFLPIARDATYPIKKMSEVGERLGKLLLANTPSDVDYAFSKAVPFLFRDGVETAQKVLTTLLSMLSMSGVTEVPMTTKAWESEVKERS